MPLHDELLALARVLVDRNPGNTIEAELRRAVSTAYYALFHLLIHEASTRLMAIPGLRPRISRSFDHRVMKTVCKEYADLSLNAQGQHVTISGQIVPAQICSIASEFVLLQVARHLADYDTAIQVTHVEADTEVTRAELAFLDWQSVLTDPAVDTFLAELLCRGIPKR